MSKARTLANLISDNAELADGQISVAEVVGAAPTASPTFTGTVTTDAVTMNGNTTIGNSSTDTLTVGATTTFTNIGTGAAAGPYVNLLRDSSSPADDDFIGILSWQGKNDADQTVTYGQIAGRIADASDGSEDARIDLQGIVAGTTRSIMQYESGLTQFNAAGQDIDFKVHSTGNTHALFVDAGNDQVGIGTNAMNSYYAKDLVVMAPDEGGITIAGDGSNETQYLMFADGTSGTARYSGYIQYEHNGDKLIFAAAGQSRLMLTSTEFLVNNSSLDQDFRVEGSGNTNMLFVDASADRVMFGGATNVENSRVGVLSAKTTSGIGIIQNQLGVTDTSDMAAGVGGGVTFNGRYLSSGGFTNFGSIEAKKSNGTSGQYGGQVVIKARRHGGDNEERISFDQTATVVNQDGHDNDFRVASDNNSHALFVDASQSYVGINRSSLDIMFEVGMSPTSNITNNTQTSLGNFGGSSRMGFGGLTNNNDGVYFGMEAIPAGIGFMREASGWNTQMRFYTNSITSGPDGTNAMQEKLRIGSTSTVFNETGRDHDFRVESENNTHMLYLNAEKDTVRLGNGGGNSAPLSLHKDKSSRYFGKFIDSTANAAAKVADLMKIDSWQSGNSRLFGTVTFWSVNPVGDYANHGRASFFAKNTASGTGNTVTTFTELEEKGTMALPTLTWTGTGLRTLTFNMPAVAYQKYIVDITFVTADGATTTLYDDAATGVDP